MSGERAQYYETLMARILYDLERKGLIKCLGKTVDETQANIKKARTIGAAMLMESQP